MREPALRCGRLVLHSYVGNTTGPAKSYAGLNAIQAIGGGTNLDLIEATIAFERQPARSSVDGHQVTAPPVLISVLSPGVLVETGVS